MAHRGKQSMRKFKKALKQGERGTMTRAEWREIRDMLGSDAGPGVRRKARNPSKRSVRKRVSAALKKYVRGNPPRVKGRKVKGGRAVSLKNFTGTVVKKANGQVQIIGKGRR